MRCISGNCRGLGNSCAVQLLVDLVRTKRPAFIFLIETLSSISQMDVIKNKLNYDVCFFVLSSGHSGGLAFLARKERSVTLLDANDHYVEVNITREEPYRVTGSYGYADRAQRE